MIDAFRMARRDPSLAILEGFHALKHALRFGAEIVAAAAVDLQALQALASGLAPDVADRMLGLIEWIDEETFAHLTPEPPTTGVVAIAHRPVVDPADVLTDPAPAVAVFLERPNHLGNIGAVIRVAAAAGAAAVLTTGERDPWHPAAIRGSAGLHYAQPVIRVDTPPRGDRPLVALDPAGTPLPSFTIPDRAVLAFGSERCGLSRDLTAGADFLVSIPMRPKVSSLNLATSVAVALYQWRLQ